MYGFRNEPMVIRAFYTESYIEKTYSDGRVIKITGRGRDTKFEMLSMLTPEQIDTLKKDLTKKFKSKNKLPVSVKND